MNVNIKTPLERKEERYKRKGKNLFPPSSFLFPLLSQYYFARLSLHYQAASSPRLRVQDAAQL
jgi:hypothetical protein